MTRVDESYQTLLANNYSGSSDLLKSTIQWLQEAFREGQTENQVRLDLEGLCKAHPSMALLHNLSAFLHKISPNPQRIDAWMDMYQKHEAAACKKFAKHLSNFTNILVHSFSGLIYESLKNVPTSSEYFLHRITSCF